MRLYVFESLKWNQKNDKTNLNWSYKYLPPTPVGSTAMNVNILIREPYQSNQGSQEEITKKNYLRYLNLLFFIRWFSILTMSSFLAFIAISLKLVCSTESVRQRKHWVGLKTFLKKTSFLWQTDDSFVALTQCNELVLRKWQKMQKKKETGSKLKITVLIKLDWSTLLV